MPVLRAIFAAVLGIVALRRIVAWDSAALLIVLNALTLIVYLPARVVTAGAFTARRWWLAGPLPSSLPPSWRPPRRATRRVPSADLGSPMPG